MQTILLAFLLAATPMAWAQDASSRTIVEVADSADNYRLMLYEATPESTEEEPVDSATAMIAVYKGNPKVLVGTYDTLATALQNITDPTALKEIELAWGQDYLKRFNSLAEAQRGIEILAQSTGPRDLSLRLIRQALPTMKWD